MFPDKKKQKNNLCSLQKKMFKMKPFEKPDINSPQAIAVHCWSAG